MIALAVKPMTPYVHKPSCTSQHIISFGLILTPYFIRIQRCPYPAMHLISRMISRVETISTTDTFMYTETIFMLLRVL